MAVVDAVEHGVEGSGHSSLGEDILVVESYLEENVV